jgi:hypothetical protein
MQTRMNVRTLILGIILGGCLTASLGAVDNSSPSSGRFAIATNEGHVFVLDTITGQVWERFTPPTPGGDSNGFYYPKIKTSAAKAGGNP